MKWLETKGDELRLMMLREPRGYPSVCCNLIVPPCHPDADAGFIVMEQTEYPAMSGGNTISVVTVLLETGILPMKEPATELTLESPAGLIGIKADCVNGKVINVTFKNVPAFATHTDVEIPCHNRFGNTCFSGNIAHIQGLALMNGSNRKEAGKSGQVSHKGLGLNFFLHIELCISCQGFRFFNRVPDKVISMATLGLETMPRK